LNRFTEAEDGATLCAVTPFTRGETPNNYLWERSSREGWGEVSYYYTSAASRQRGVCS
jgi:hypothetical protein